VWSARWIPYGCILGFLDWSMQLLAQQIAKSTVSWPTLLRGGSDHDAGSESPCLMLRKYSDTSREKIAPVLYLLSTTP
jgi:hypothetical protein